MKNKLTAIFTSILMCLSLCSLFPVSAEETTTTPEETTTEVTATETTTAANGFEDYTFEEFVALTPEEIGEISTEALDFYEDIIDCIYSQRNMFSGTYGILYWICFPNEIKEQYIRPVDWTKITDDLKLSADVIDGDQYITPMNINNGIYSLVKFTVNKSKCSDYGCEEFDFVAKVGT